MDPDADGTACEALDVPGPELMLESEKEPKKEPNLAKRSESKKKFEWGKEPAPKRKPQ